MVTPELPWQLFELEDTDNLADYLERIIHDRGEVIGWILEGHLSVLANRAMTSHDFHFFEGPSPSAVALSSWVMHHICPVGCHGHQLKVGYPEGEEGDHITCVIAHMKV